MTHSNHADDGVRMTRINSSSTSAHAQRSQAENQDNAHTKGLGLDSFKPHKPHLPHKPSDLLKPHDPTPKPPGLSDLPKPPSASTLKPPGHFNIPGLPRIPHNPLPGLQDRVSGFVNGVLNRVNPKPTTDPTQATPSHQYHKTK